MMNMCRFAEHSFVVLTAIVVLLFAGACSPKVYRGGAASERGKASYYADKFHGRPTASGEIYNQNKLTAAHRSIPFGTTVAVKNMDNGKVVHVKINDRGPAVAGRILDVSKGAAKKLGMMQAGVVPVEISYATGAGGASSTKKTERAKTTKTKKKKTSFNRGKKR